MGASVTTASGATVAASSIGAWSAGVGVLSGAGGLGAAALGAAAIGGAVGSIASQGVAMAMGMQDSFSWKGVATSALGSAAAAGIGAAARAANVLATSSWGDVALRAAGSSVLSQGVGATLGVGSFSWKAVAASAAGAGASTALGNTDWMQGMNSVAAGTVKGLVSGGVQAGIFDTKPNWGSIAAQSFGQAVGDSTVEQIQQSDFERSVPKVVGADEKVALLGMFEGGPDVEPAGNGLRLTADAAARWSDRVDLGIRDAKESVEAVLPVDQVGALMNGSGAVIRRGYTADGRPFEEWNTGATAIGVPLQPAIVGVPLGPLSTDGTGLRDGSIKADQGYWASLSGIANSDLSLTDKVGMVWGTTKYYFRNSDEAQGTLQMVGGGLEVAGAVGLSSTGAGAALGVPLAFHGGDNIGTGLNRLMGWGSNPTVTYQLVDSTTGSPALASMVDQGIPFLGGVATVGQGLRMAESRIFNSTVYRGLTAQDAAALDDGLGLTAKNPDGVWTAEDHVANFKFGTRGGALKNDPWIGTTRDYDVVVGPKGYDSGNGIVAINLNRVSNAQVEVWQTTARSNIYKLSEPYHRSIWAQEVSVYQSVPARAIYTPFTPITQVPVYRPVTYGLTIGGTGFTTNRGGSE